MTASTASPAELARYAERAQQYRELASRVRDHATLAVTDRQVRALALTWALECDDLAARWAREKRKGGL